MAHLAKFRDGWSNENLAQFILYKFAFISNPSKIADDIGLDFICTLIESRIEEKNTYLFPKNSFAIQIKSNKRKIDITSKIEFLSNLELPFLIGVANRRELKLSFYSGEFIHPFFSYLGKSINLKIRLSERKDEYQIDDYFEKVDSSSYIIDFPFITEISANENLQEIRRKVNFIQGISSTIQSNISSRRNNEYIFTIFGKKSPQSFMFAGTGSVETYRENVKNRITEAFYNMNWLFDVNPKYLDLEEYSMYKEFYQKLGSLPMYKPLPKFLVDTFEDLYKKIENIA